MREKELARFLSTYDGPPLRLMEVCGTHTSSLYRSGIRQILSPKITLLSGPGCPVCVTPTAYIDKLVSYAMTEGYKVLAFGDLLAVPGSRLSLPEEGLAMAAKDRQTTYVLAAVGFETTAPVWADLVKRAYDENIGNIRFLTALKTMPEAMDILARDLHIDGFLCPGHVAVITGSRPFFHLAETSGKPMVIGGFTPPLLLRALSRLVLEASRKKGGLWNEYPSVVREEGNPKALSLMHEIFEAGDAVWRGLGTIRGSGLYISGKYEFLDAGSRSLTEDVMPKGCSCASVLTGRMVPQNCPCFGKACTPDHPVGACMVSGEGACSITYRGG